MYRMISTKVVNKYRKNIFFANRLKYMYRYITMHVVEHEIWKFKKKIQAIRMRPKNIDHLQSSIITKCKLL